MGAPELLAEFDPFIREHIEQRELRPKSSIAYLSKTIYEQIIEIMGKQIIKTITTQINNDDTKYYLILMDVVPDLSHNDQLAIVLRYCFRGKVWELLNREIKLKCTVKCLNQTRWSCHYDAVEALKDNYDNIMNIFKTFSDNENEKIGFRKEAVNLCNKLRKLETAILIIFWEEILERFNSVNKKLQTPGLDICDGNKLIMSIKTFISNVRHESDKKLNEYQDAAKRLSPSVETQYSDVNKRRVISKFSDKSTEKVAYGTEKFKRDKLIVALDKLIFDLNRSQVYAEYSKKFKFLMDF
ncbi:zinc finger MYM-type protein 1 [Trichonephila clavipes]|nr:zinc finger MYM-type protein 1 [Trichonephila clavipes]